MMMFDVMFSKVHFRKQDDSDTEESDEEFS